MLSIMHSFLGSETPDAMLHLVHDALYAYPGNKPVGIASMLYTKQRCTMLELLSQRHLIIQARDLLLRVDPAVLQSWFVVATRCPHASSPSFWGWNADQVAAWLYCTPHIAAYKTMRVEDMKESLKDLEDAFEFAVLHERHVLHEWVDGKREEYDEWRRTKKPTNGSPWLGLHTYLLKWRDWFVGSEVLPGSDVLQWLLLHERLLLTRDWENACYERIVERTELPATHEEMEQYRTVGFIVNACAMIAYMPPETQGMLRSLEKDGLKNVCERSILHFLRHTTKPLVAEKNFCEKTPKTPVHMTPKPLAKTSVEYKEGEQKATSDKEHLEAEFVEAVSQECVSLKNEMFNTYIKPKMGLYAREAFAVYLAATTMDIALRAALTKALAFCWRKATQHGCI